MESSYRTRIRVLRLCSVFEPPPSALVGRGVKFDPIGGMQNHTAELTRALDRRGVVQTVLTTRPPTAPYFQRLGDHARVIRLGLPIRRFRQLYGPQAAIIVPILAARAYVVHVHLGEDLAVLPSGPRPPSSIVCRWSSPSTLACATPSPSATFARPS
jgi:glycogen synthase